MFSKRHSAFQTSKTVRSCGKVQAAIAVGTAVGHDDGARACAHDGAYRDHDAASRERDAAFRDHDAASRDHDTASCDPCCRKNGGALGKGIPLRPPFFLHPQFPYVVQKKSSLPNSVFIPLPKLYQSRSSLPLCPATILCHLERKVKTNCIQKTRPGNQLHPENKAWRGCASCSATKPPLPLRADKGSGDFVVIFLHRPLSLFWSSFLFSLAFSSTMLTESRYPRVRNRKKQSARRDRRGRQLARGLSPLFVFCAFLCWSECGKKNLCGLSVSRLFSSSFSPPLGTCSALFFPTFSRFFIHFLMPPFFLGDCDAVCAKKR